MSVLVRGQTAHSQFHGARSVRFCKLNLHKLWLAGLGSRKSDRGLRITIDEFPGIKIRAFKAHGEFRGRVTHFDQVRSRCGKSQDSNVAIIVGYRSGLWQHAVEMRWTGQCSLTPDDFLHG